MCSRRITAAGRDASDIRHTIATRAAAWSFALALYLTLGATSALAEPPSSSRDELDASRDDRRTSVDSASELAELSLSREKDAARAALSSLEPEEIAVLLQRYAREPSAIAVARAALRAADQDPERFASMLRRARWRGLVPTLALGARRGQGADLRTVTDDEGIRFTSGDDLVVSATLRFELGRLMFADEEVMISREARAAKAARLELVRDVIHWYYLRRRLQLERDALGHTSVTREVKIAEIEALLDVFTNGYFRRMIEGQRKEWTTDESTPGSGQKSPRRSTSRARASPRRRAMSRKAAHKSSRMRSCSRAPPLP